MSRFVNWLRDGAPVALSSAFLVAGLSLADGTGQGPGQTLALFLIGLLYGYAVRAIAGILPFRGPGHVLAGFLAGPIPPVLLLSLSREPMSKADRGGVWLVAALIGLILGLAEWATESARARDEV